MEILNYRLTIRKQRYSQNKSKQNINIFQKIQQNLQNLIKE